jgi:NADH-quinone oxidoreductase subunit L
MSYAPAILLLPLLTAAAILLGLKRSANISALVATGSAVATFFLSIAMLMTKEWMPAGTELNTLLPAFGIYPSAVVELFNWSEVPGLKLGIDLQVDALSSGMMIVVTGVGALVHIFSLAYMKDDAGKARYFAGLSLFMFSMTGIVLAANFAMMFIFWELVGVSSYILIGHWYQKNSAADAAKKAFLTNRIGDFGFMIGILMLWSMTGGLLDFDSLQTWFGSTAAASVAPAALTAATLLIFCGTVGKSAQFPLHVWLPDAMEGPTPVSALIHAATMVAAGVYMLVRVSFLIAASTSAACVIAWIGGLTALLAALMATQQNDIKRILAYSTLSQLGYMVMAVGLGASQASMFHLFTHAWFKAGLFLGSGAIIYACHHEQNIWKMGGLKAKMPVTFATFALCTAALIAVPGTSGWWSKEGILDAAWANNKLLFLLAAGTAFLTAFYMTRLVVVAFLGKARDEHGAGHAHEVGGLMKLPLVLLAALAVVGGFLGSAVLGADYGKFVAVHFSVPMIASLLTLAAGVGLAWKLYNGRDTDPVNIKLFANKFYFDEIYAKLIAVVQDGVAYAVKVFDALFIDGAGVGGAKGIQSGNLQAYAFLFGLGVLVIVFLAMVK